jgi:hypothetical protein
LETTSGWWSADFASEVLPIPPGPSIATLAASFSRPRTTSPNSESRP